MRFVYGSAIALAIAIHIPSAISAQGGAPMETARAVAGGGITVPGWVGKIDANEEKAGQVINNAKFAPDGAGIRVTTGPAVTYWNPANRATGDYTVKATFNEAKQPYNHPHPYGVFIGGKGLDGDQPQALYCAAYRNGTYIVRGFSGGKPFQIVQKPAPNDAIQKAAADAPVTQTVALSVRGDKVDCTVNGTSVWSATKADVTGAGKLDSTDGITGIRVSHNSDALVSNFAVGK